MSTLKIGSALVLGLALGYAGAASAAKDDSSANERSSSYDSQSTSIQQVQPVERASNLIGMEVKNPADESLGKIKDIILSEDGQQVAYLALDPAGLSNNRLVQMPVDKATRSADGKFLVYDVSKARVGSDAAAIDTSIPWSRKASELLGLEVRDSANNRAGKVRDLLVDMQSHRITTATIATGGFIGIGEKLASVEWTSVTLQPADKYASVKLSAEDLKNLAFDENEYWEHLGFAGKDENTRSGSQQNSMSPSSTTPSSQKPESSRSY